MKSLLLLATHLACLAGCSSGVAMPDLGGLYSRSAGAGDDQRNPVIVIPGILGSRLVTEQTRRVVWGAFAGDYADPRTEEGARLVALPMALGVPLNELHDSVVSDGALDRIKVNILLEEPR